MSAKVVAAPRLVGRDAVTARLGRLLGGADDNPTGSALLLGARGIGRTAVLNTVASGLRPPPVRVVGVPCQARFDYASLVHALNGAVSHPGLGPLVGPLLQVLSEGGTNSTHAVARRLLSTMRRALTREPVVLLVDDVHHFDVSSQQTVAYLAHHGPAAGLRVLLSADEAADLTSFVGLERTRLGALDLHQLRAMLELAVEVPLPYRVAQPLHRWSGGNPLLALDLAGQLDVDELSGTRPIGLPLVPSAAFLERVGAPVQSLSHQERSLLALFATSETLPLDWVQSVPAPAELVDTLVGHNWLMVHQRTVEPRRRADALVAWATLTPSAQQDLHLQLAARLEPTRPAAADYLAALGGSETATQRLVTSATELYTAGDAELGAAACALALRQENPTPGQAVLLTQLLTAEGYVDAARAPLARVDTTGQGPPGPRLNLLTDLSAMSGDASTALTRVDVSRPPEHDPDTWVRAVLVLCRLQLALDGPNMSSRLFQSVQPVVTTVGDETAALAALVAAERGVYRQETGSPQLLGVALDTWLAHRSGGLDLAAMSAALDLLGLGRVGAARDLLSSADSRDQLRFATVRAAQLMLRTETEIAVGDYRRAAASLLDHDRARPSPSGADLMVASQAIRIGAVCDDVSECPAIEERLSRSTGAVLSYPARRAHTAALGYRELVLGNFAQSRDLLSLALHGPALLLQGRSCILADLVEATAADGDLAEAEQLLLDNLDWLPDLDGERARGLVARCRAIVAAPEEVDAGFQAALDAAPPGHELDRARTMLAYGRTLIAHHRVASAAHPLNAAAELFRECRLPGWERHVRRLQELVFDSPPRPGGLEEQLTEMEQQILGLVMQRKRNREIADTLFVSLRTVESHLTRIFRKLGVATKAQLFRQLSAESEREPA